MIAKVILGNNGYKDIHFQDSADDGREECNLYIASGGAKSQCSPSYALLFNYSYWLPISIS